MIHLLARNWWVLALRVVFAVVFGVLALAVPGITLGALILLFGAYAVADGILAIASGIRAARRQDRWWVLVIEGLTSALHHR